MQAHGLQVHGAHQAASHKPALLYLPSRSQYSFTDPERMDGWVSLGPGCKEQLVHGCYATADSQLDSNQRPVNRACQPLGYRVTFNMSSACTWVYHWVTAIMIADLQLPCQLVQRLWTYPASWQGHVHEWPTGVLMWEHKMAKSWNVDLNLTSWPLRHHVTQNWIVI